MNLNHSFEKTVLEFGDRPAISVSDKLIDWKTLYEAVCRLARGMQKLGIRRRDRVAIILPNVPHFLICYHAILRIGAVAVPLNTMYKGRELAELLEDCEARAVIAWDGIWDDIANILPDLPSLKHTIVLGEDTPSDVLSLTRLIAKSTPMRDITDVDGDDSAVVQYTAGVVGSPKGVDLSHNNLQSNANACRDIMRVTVDDRLLAAIPLFHPMGQTLLVNLATTTGASLDLHPRFEPETILESVRSGMVSLFPAVQSTFRILLDASGEEDEPPEKPVRLCVSGGGPLDEDILKEFERRFGSYILECYIMTETSPVISFNQWRTGRRVGSLGHPIPGVEMRVVNEGGDEVSIGEVGEIVVKGSNVMRGYINRPRLTADILEDGWLHTGDLGRMDINGFFYLVDRLHYRILKGGFSIFPNEVENVMYGHPDVKEVAVVPVPDEVMGQEIKACVVLKEHAVVTTEQLSDYCKERMAIYKAPSVIRFYKDLPHTPTGRIDKSELMQ